MFIFSYVLACVSGSYPAAALVYLPHKKSTETLKSLNESFWL